MATKIQQQGNIPAVAVDHVQYIETVITSSTKPPYVKAVSMKVKLYGKDGNGLRVYSDAHIDPVGIGDLVGFITQLPPADQAKAAIGMAKVQEGLAVLFELKTGIPVVGVE